MTARSPMKWFASLIAGQSPPSNEVDDFTGEGVPFLQGNAEFGPEYPTPVHRCDTASKRVRAGDILLCGRQSGRSTLRTVATA